MKRFIISKIYDAVFVPALIGGMAFLGYVLYSQGQADAISKIYKNGWCVVDESGDDMEFKEN